MFKVAKGEITEEQVRLGSEVLVGCVTGCQVCLLLKDGTIEWILEKDVKPIMEIAQVFKGQNNYVGIGDYVNGEIPAFIKLHQRILKSNGFARPAQNRSCN